MSDVTFDEAQQARVDQLVGEARVKSREKAQADALEAQRKVTEDAEKANLAAKGEWQKLVAASEARVKALEPLEVTVKQYETLIADMLADRVKALGDKAKALLKTLPESMGALDRLSFLNANVELFQVETQPAVGTPRGSAGATKDQPRNKRVKL